MQRQNERGVKAHTRLNFLLEQYTHDCHPGRVRARHIGRFVRSNTADEQTQTDRCRPSSPSARLYHPHALVPNHMLLTSTQHPDADCRLKDSD